jgi:hypothetical protein
MKTKYMSQYKNLRLNPPKLTVKENAKEVIFKTISAMCDNVGYLRFKKNNDGETPSLRPSKLSCR